MNWFMIRESLGMASRALLANRMRTSLALLGIVIGVATVIGMVALINGFQRSVQRSIQSLGSNTIYIRRIRPGINFGDIPDSLKQRRAFTIDDAKAIMAHSNAVRAIAPFKWAFADIQLQYRGRNTRSTFVYGTNEDYLTTHGYDLSNGRFFTQEEVTRRANVVVLGQKTRETLFKDGAGIGERIHLNGIPFTVIGEFEKKGKMFGNDFDQVAAIPYTVIDKYFPAPTDAPIWFPKRGELFLDAIPVSPELSDQAQRDIIETLRIRRHLPSNKTNNFVVFTDDAFMALYNALTGAIFLVMGGVSLVSLFVGGIGVMNIMLVAVTERTREIGVRKALGAPRAAILSQFLFEAIVLSVVGGGIGILFGNLISWGIHAASQMPTFVSLWSVITAIVVSTAVGLFSGFYPAMRAARLDPVDSLRFE